MQKLLFVYYHSENRATSQIWKVLPNMVFPQIGGKNGGVLSMPCKLSWTLFSPARVQPPYGAGRKESSETGLIFQCLYNPNQSEARDKKHFAPQNSNQRPSADCRIWNLLLLAVLQSALSQPLIDWRLLRTQLKVRTARYGFCLKSPICLQNDLAMFSIYYLTSCLKSI